MLPIRKLLLRLAVPAAAILLNACALASSRPALGLWVPAEGASRPLLTAEKTAELASRAEAAEVSDLFVQVFRGGRAWWPSETFERGYEGDRDPLKDLLEQARSKGIRVHAWINVYNLSTSPSPKALERLGDKALTADNTGRSVKEYLAAGRPDSEPELDTPGYWLDPASPEAQEFVLAAVRELVKGYPDLAGIHLDFIRYPYALPLKPVSTVSKGVEFGYGEAARLRFPAETGGDLPLKNATAPALRRFADWRRDQVTELTGKIRSEVPSRMKLSAAGLAWSDRAYLSAFQDWRRWLEERTVDFVVSMTYSRDERFHRYLVDSAVASEPPRITGSPRAWVAVGAWDLGADPGAFHRELEVAAAASPSGVVIFSYDDIAKSPALIETIGRWQRKEPAPLPDGTLPPKEGGLFDWLMDFIAADQREYEIEMDARQKAHEAAKPPAPETAPQAPAEAPPGEAPKDDAPAAPAPAAP